MDGHMDVSFPYLGITLRPSLHVLPGVNTTKAPNSIDHVYRLKSHLFVEFALVSCFFDHLISSWDQIYKKVGMNHLVIS